MNTKTFKNNDKKDGAEQEALLHLPGKSEALALPVRQGTYGKPVLDIGGLGPAGYFTYDPGYAMTAATESAITFIDGEKGVLLYRGYPIEELSEKSSYLETCYLLLHGELPNPSALKSFTHSITYHTMVHEKMQEFVSGFRVDAHPMAVVCGIIGALSAFYHDALDITNARDREICAHRLIAKMPTIAAMAFKYLRGEPIIYPRNDLSYTANFMRMMFANPCEDYAADPIFVKALDVIFILHADHEQNASTSTVRLAGSTGANPFACIAAGVAALWGPAHGGANEAVLNMLAEIGETKNIPAFIKKAKDPDDPFRLMGFGHRVYKNYDPRAKVLKQICADVLAAKGVENDKTLQLAQQLEKIALEDEYFVERKLYPNVDFYSGIILRALGIPVNMFTVIFALGRTVGWIAHWNEMISNSYRIGRPQQVYTGHRKRSYPG